MTEWSVGLEVGVALFRGFVEVGEGLEEVGAVGSFGEGLEGGGVVVAVDFDGVDSGVGFDVGGEVCGEVGGEAVFGGDEDDLIGVESERGFHAVFGGGGALNGGGVEGFGDVGELVFGGEAGG